MLYGLNENVLKKHLSMATVIPFIVYI